MSTPRAGRKRGHAGSGPRAHIATPARTTMRKRGRRGSGTRGDPGELVRLMLTVNGEPHDVLVAGYKTLLELLREDLNLTGTKHGCELGECGACAVLVEGEPVLSCLRLAVECGGARVTTVEGLARGAMLSALQREFADRGAAQCGYCTPGILVTAQALLDRKERPTRAEIAEALSGNLCRCTGYRQIIEAVEAAAGERTRLLPRGEGHGRRTAAPAPARRRAAEAKP